MSKALISPVTEAYYTPDMEELRAVATAAGNAIPTADEVARILSRLGGAAPDLGIIARLLHALLGPESAAAGDFIMQHGAVLRGKLFGNAVVPMAPVELSNACASDCRFCGWRVSNRAMKRLKMPADLAMAQVEYLVDQGIHYIEFVSGDDISIVRGLLPELIADTRTLFRKRGIEGKVSFCTLALTQSQYRDLRGAGADSMIVWQETYDPEVFREHVVGGPKAFGISDDWKVNRDGDGCRFRIESQERAMRAGLEVALGSMLGLNPDIVTEFLATVDHARALAERYGATPEHPIIIGMPIWNAITTRDTDLRPRDIVSLVDVFPALAALYLIALPSNGTWVFPNCRVPLATQIEAARVAGAFSSTEVKLGPGGYMPAVLRAKAERGEDVTALQERLLALVQEVDAADAEALQRALDSREQFLHHWHAHEVYRDKMERAGLTLVDGTRIPA